MAKRPTRVHVDVVDPDGIVMWEVLMHDYPTARLRSILNQHGLRLVRQSEGSTEATNLIYSERDPINSILAAQEYHARRETKIGAVLMLLLRNMPDWVDRDEVRKVGGDSGDRRVRELRERHWPIELVQLDTHLAWHCRMANEDLLRSWDRMLGSGRDDPGKLF